MITDFLVPFEYNFIKEGTITSDRGFIVNGREIKTGEQVPVYNKYTGEEIYRVFNTPDSYLEEAVCSAVQAKSLMAEMPLHQRSHILREAARIISEKKTHFIDLIISEAGKPWKYALGEVNRTIENLGFCAEEAKQSPGELIPMSAATGGVGRFGYFKRTPAGIVLAISPFNFPLNLAVHKIGPAIAAGCPVIFKPSSLTPVTGLELSRVFLEAGLPASALQALTGGGSSLGNKLISREEISKISFTGSLPVGQHILEKSGLKKVTMELGSNSGIVVDKDVVDLDYLVQRSVLGSFAYQGQVCISVQRIYLHHKIFDSFLEKFLTLTSSLKVGDPRHQDCDIGPMISAKEADRVINWLDEAAGLGAQIHCGNTRTDNILHPTVIGAVSPKMKIMTEEVFGPVVSLIKTKSWEEGLIQCEDSQYGLQTGIFTRDISKALKAVDRINSGGVIINDIPTYRVDQMPYGGNKNSGIGREGARFAIEEMSNLKTVVIKL